MYSILVISGDAPSRGLLSATLDRADFDVLTAPSCDEAVPLILRTRVDAAVLDSAPPEESIRLGERLREGRANFPLLFLAPPAAKWLPGCLPGLQPEDRVIFRPFSPQEVVAALKQALAGDKGEHVIMPLAGLDLDTFSYRLSGNGLSVHLTPMEYKLVTYLADKKGQTASPRELLEKVWEFYPGTGSSEVVRAHMRNLRLKLRSVAPETSLIETIPRRGYRLVV